MTLIFIYTLLAGIFFLGLGIFFFLNREDFKQKSIDFLRSKKWAYILFGLGTLWFVYILSQLGEADFGDFKGLLILLFGGAGLLSFFYLEDFLSVRGLCVLLLLSSRAIQDAAFMQDIPARLVVVSISYVVIVFAIYFGCLPYRMRDFFNYMYAKSVRQKIFSLTLVSTGVAILTSTLFY